MLKYILVNARISVKIPKAKLIDSLMCFDKGELKKIANMRIMTWSNLLSSLFFMYSKINMTIKIANTI